MNICFSMLFDAFAVFRAMTCMQVPDSQKTKSNEPCICQDRISNSVLHLSNINILKTTELLTFCGGDLQVVYRNPLGLAYKPKLLCKKTSEFCLID